MSKNNLRYLLLIINLVLFMPFSVFAQDLDTNSSVNDNTAVESQNTVNESADSVLDINTNNESNDDEFETIKNAIGQNVDVDILESQSYDYSDNDDTHSVLNDAVLDVIQQRLNDNNIDYVTLGYSFIPDCVKDDSFYNGAINVYRNNLLIESINISINYLNTAEHINSEQEFVEEFINTNDFSYEEKVDLEDYENYDYNLDSKVNEISESYDIKSKAINSTYAGTSNESTYACFYNDKYYGTLVANLDLSIIVKVPSNVSDIENYALNKIKSYFINYYNNRGMSNLITTNTQMFFNNNYVFAGDVLLGKFIIEKQKIVDPIPVNDYPTADKTSSNESNTYDNYYRPYKRNYYSKVYYTDFVDDSNSGSTFGEEEKTIDISKITNIKNVNTTKKTDNKKTTKKSETKKTEKKEESVEKKDSSKNKDSSVKKILLIVLSGILLIGVIVGLFNKLFIHPEL